MLSGGLWLEVAAFNGQAMAFYEASGWMRAGESFEDVGGVQVATFLMGM